MTDQETTLLIQDIINKALEGKEHPFRSIRYWSEYRYYRRWTGATKLIIRTLQASSNKLFKEYCRDVIAGISDITKILAYEQLLDITAFYKKDLDTVQAMLLEYEDYLGEGNFWYSFLGGRRE